MATRYRITYTQQQQKKIAYNNNNNIHCINHEMILFGMYGFPYKSSSPECQVIAIHQSHVHTN